MREACCTPGGNKWNNLDVCTAGANSCLGRPFDLGSADAAAASLTYETNEFLLGALFKERLAACSVAPERAELVLVPYEVGELKAQSCSLRDPAAATTLACGLQPKPPAVRRLRARARLSHKDGYSDVVGNGASRRANWKNVTMHVDCADPHVPQSFSVVLTPLRYVHGLGRGRPTTAAWSRFVLGRRGAAARTAHRTPRRDLQASTAARGSPKGRSCDGTAPGEPRKVAIT